MEQINTQLMNEEAIELMEQLAELDASTLFVVCINLLDVLAARLPEQTAIALTEIMNRMQDKEDPEYEFLTSALALALAKQPAQA